MALRTSDIIIASVYIPCLTRILRAPGGTLYTVGSCGESYNRAELYISEDNGVTWSQEVIVTDDELEDILGGDRRITDLSFAVDSYGSVHVLLQAFGISGSPAPLRPIMHMKRTSGVWSTPTQIEPSTYQGGCWVAVDSDDTAHIVFEHKVSASQWDIYYNSVTKDGTWSGNEIVASATGYRQREPVVKVGPDNVVYVFCLSRGWGTYPSLDQLRCWKRTNGVWGSRIDITDTNINHHGSFTIDREGVVHFIWNEPTTHRFIHKSLSGDTLSAAENCTDINSVALGTPDVCITNNGQIYLFCYELITDGWWYYIIKYLVRIGGVWKGPYTLLSNSNIRDAYPRAMNDYYPLSDQQSASIPTNPIFIYSHRPLVGDESLRFAELTPTELFVINKAYALAREEL